MPNIHSSVQSVRLDEKRRTRNTAIKSTVKTSIRKADEAVIENRVEEVANLISKAASKIDRAAAAGVLHPNTAARKKSRLAKRANKVAAQ